MALYSAVFSGFEPPTFLRGSRQWREYSRIVNERNATVVEIEQNLTAWAQNQSSELGVCFYLPYF